jgi:tRNA U34 5-carboxymethylaminomethyl modifying GTPase MnmE/TrmE
MKDDLKVTLNELKSAQLIIKILQDEIKTQPRDSVKAVNLSNCVDKKSDLKQLTTNGNVSEWNKIRCNKHSSNQSKKILNDLKQHTSHNLLTKNRVEPLSDHQNHVLQRSYDQTKSKTLSESRNSDFNKHRIIVLGDSHVRGCSEKLANILGNIQFANILGNIQCYRDHKTECERKRYYKFYEPKG